MLKQYENFKLFVTILSGDYKSGIQWKFNNRKEYRNNFEVNIGMCLHLK